MHLFFMVRAKFAHLVRPLSLDLNVIPIRLTPFCDHTLYQDQISYRRDFCSGPHVQSKLSIQRSRFGRQISDNNYLLQVPLSEPSIMLVEP